MMTQHILIYGLSRSPILAHFQKIPITLSGQLLAFGPFIARADMMVVRIPILISVHDTRGEMVDIGARANQQQEDE